MFAPRQLARLLGGQYLAGGVLALVLALLPPTSAAPWRGTIVVLGILACALGAVMGVISVAPLSVRTLDLAAHLCIISAQLVITVGYATTRDASNTYAIFLLWTTAYAGLFSGRARWAHVTLTAVLLGAASLTMPNRALAGVEYVFMLATIVVVTLLVSRIVDQLRLAATHDALTGLPNRRLFHTAAKAALARRATKGGSVHVLMVDLDRFKNINDSYGHGVGDSLLTELAGRLTSALRETDVVARLGGDEFAILCEDRTGRLEAQQIWDRLEGAWAEPVQIGDRRVYVNGCVGVAIAGDDDTPETLLRDADAAMYDAKAAGSGRWRLYDPLASGRDHRRMAIENGLREAVERAELAVHYQPVISLTSGRPIGVEGLLRWTSGELGPVGPDEFIEIAETCALMPKLGLWVLDHALTDLATWRRDGVVGEEFQVAVNVSARQLTEDLPDDVAALLIRHRIPPGALGLEVTESALMIGETPTVVLGRLHALGLTLMLDDFGTGHSSLSHLRRYPLDVVKIDRSFVSGMCQCAEDRALVVGVISLAHALGKTVVAEGIESFDQLEALRAAGCDAGQGFLLGRPVPAEELTAKLEPAGHRNLDDAAVWSR